MKIIKVRKGTQGKLKYYACRDNGRPLKGFERLSDVRNWFYAEIKLGLVCLVRELDQAPDFSKIKNDIEVLEAFLKHYQK